MRAESSRMAYPGRLVRVPFSARLVEVGPTECLVDLRDNEPVRSYSRDELLMLLEGAPIPESAPGRISLWYPGHVVSETGNKIEVLFEDKTSYTVRSSLVKEAAPAVTASNSSEAQTGPGTSNETSRQANTSRRFSPITSEEGLPVKAGHFHQNRRPSKRTRLERQESGVEESARRVQQKSTRKATDATTAQMPATPAAAAAEKALEAARLCAEANRQASEEKTQLVAEKAQLEAAADEAASAAEVEKAELEAEKAQLQAALDKANSVAEAEKTRHEAEKARLEAALDEANSTAAAEKAQLETDKARLEAVVIQTKKWVAGFKQRSGCEAEKGKLEAALEEANGTAAAEKAQLEVEKAQLEAEKAEGSRSAAAEKAKFKASLDKHKRSAAAEKAQLEAEKGKLEAEKAQLEAEKAQLEAEKAEGSRSAAAEKAKFKASLDKHKRSAAAEKAQLEAEKADGSRSAAAEKAQLEAEKAQLAVAAECNSVAAAEKVQLEAAVAEANRLAEAEQAKLAARFCASSDRLVAEKGQLEMEKAELESALNVAQTGWDAAKNERDRTQASLRELQLKVQDLTQAKAALEEAGIIYGGLDQTLSIFKSTDDLNQVAPGLGVQLQARVVSNKILSSDCPELGSPSSGMDSLESLWLGGEAPKRNLSEGIPKLGSGVDLAALQQISLGASKGQSKSTDSLCHGIDAKDLKTAGLSMESMPRISKSAMESMPRVELTSLKQAKLEGSKGHSQSNDSPFDEIDTNDLEDLADPTPRVSSADDLLTSFPFDGIASDVFGTDDIVTDGATSGPGTD